MPTTLPDALSMTRGTVVLVGLDPIHGHEQSGMRPCVTVSDPAVAEDRSGLR